MVFFGKTRHLSTCGSITTVIKGVSYISENHTTLFPFYNIRLKAKTSRDYYLEVKSIYEPIDFGIKIEDTDKYLARDRSQQFINIMLIGMVLALMFYSFLVSFYTKDKSYSYYSLYLFLLIYQQMTYLGLTQIYFPPEIVLIDIKMPVIKISLLIITAALFAMSFLKTDQRPQLHKIYKIFIFVAIIEMIMLSLPGMYNLNIVIITGALFIMYNLSASIISYRQGYTQARLFIVGFGIVFFSYFLIILDALGLTSVMQDFQNILMFGTAFEALILSLAFADRYIMLQKEKEKVDARILLESKNRTHIIENEVIKKTQELNNVLETKELLIKEVHHRVKNNLQIILSIIRLQNDEIEDKYISGKFINLENRINAISKTYNMLLINDDLEEINIQEYIDSLLLDIQQTLDHKNQQIEIITDINAIIPLREAVYIGLIINELVTNAYKYAFDNNKGTISISLQEHGNDFVLTIQDNGKGFVIEENTQSLGLKLIHTLIYDQLGGSMEISTNDHTKYTIRFSL
jgi:two-component sensor histidine kinase